MHFKPFLDISPCAPKKHEVAFLVPTIEIGAKKSHDFCVQSLMVSHV